MLNQIIGFPRAVYNFFVGDPVILTGVVAFFIVIGLIAGHSQVGKNQPLVLGVVLIAGVILSLSLSLYRETRPKK
jgi:hypothetical protein